MALILGKRMGFEIHVVRPHNVPAVMLGCGLLFVGWFGFNGGSALAADGYAALAICNTLLAGYAASASWLVVERIVTGKPTLVGGCTGILAGLVVITPACGFVDPMIAIVMGIIVSPICYFFIAVLKRKLGWDDALDAFGCHGVGGIVGCILTGIFALPELSFNGLGGLLYTGDPTLLINQCLSVLATVVYVGITTAIIGFWPKRSSAAACVLAKMRKRAAWILPYTASPAIPRSLALISKRSFHYEENRRNSAHIKARTAQRGPVSGGC